MTNAMSLALVDAGVTPKAKRAPRVHSVPAGGHDNKTPGTPIIKEENVLLKTEHADGVDDGSRVLFEGTVMPRAEAMAKLAEADKIQRGVAYYSPQDTIDNMVSPQLKAQVRSSMAWYLDIMIINKARKLFYALFADAMLDELDPTIDRFNYFIGQVGAMQANGQYVEDMGFETNTGALTEIGLLMSLHRQWHELAETSRKIPGKLGSPYAPKSFEQLMAEEKPQVVTADACTNFTTLAVMSNEGDMDAYGQALLEGKSVDEAVIASGVEAKLVAESVALMTKKAMTDNTKNHASRMQTMPAIASILTMAEYNMSDDVEFHMLAIDTQISLITSTYNCVKNTRAQLATWKGISAMDYALEILPSGTRAMKALDAALNSPKFAQS